MKKTKAFKEKALEIIDCLCEQNHCNWSTCDKDGKHIETKELKLLMQIYEIAHAARDTSCEHKLWEQRLEDTYKSFKEHGLL